MYGAPVLCQRRVLVARRVGVPGDDDLGRPCREQAAEHGGQEWLRRQVERAER